MPVKERERERKREKDRERERERESWQGILTEEEGSVPLTSS